MNRFTTSEKAFKDESNKRLVELAKLIGEKMGEEKRGFIFATTPQQEGDHKTFVAVGGTDIIGFWAGICSIIENMTSQIPENNLPLWNDGFEATVHCLRDRCFLKKGDDND